MKNVIKKLLITFIAFMPLTLLAQKVYELKDASGKVQINVSVNKNNIEYAVYHDGDVMIDKSPISMTLSDGTVFGKDPKVRRTRRRSVNETLYPPVYKKTSIKDNYNELRMDFRGGYSLLLRAYEDGAAYRFISNLKHPFEVVNEEVYFAFADNPKVYVSTPKGRKVEGKVDPFYSAFQNTYDETALSEWDSEEIAFLPVMAERANGKKVVITEADLLSYPGLYLKRSNDGTAFEGVFAPYPKKIVEEVQGLKGAVVEREEYIARANGSTEFPWRTVIISENDFDLLDNDMVYKLATPAQFDDFSWIKPGKVAWDWWNFWNIYGVDFKAGINNDTYKYYIDFASQFGIEYVILDEGWAVPGAADLFKVVDDIDLEELISYGRSKNVDLVLWAGYRAFEKDMERVCEHYSKMGIKGFKIDFMDRDDQPMVDFHRKASEVAAKHKLLVNFHGTYKPTGLQRTYPNAINFEGVHGLEEVKWAEPGTDQVLYDVVMPFIRMVAGPLDYTQGAMNNAIKDNFRAIYTEPMSQGTRGRQLATYIIFDSPMNMLCDAPTNYLKEPEYTQFVANIPTVWDETAALDGKVGEHIIMARQKDDVWYVGGLTNWDKRDVSVDLSFLGSGQFEAEIYKDGVNAHRVAKDYKREVVTVSANNKLDIHMAPGGGFVVKFVKK